MENENSGMITMHRNYTRNSRDINKVEVHQIRVKRIFYSTSHQKEKKKKKRAKNGLIYEEEGKTKIKSQLRLV